MTFAPPPEPDALAEEARVEDLYRTVPLALWLGAAVAVGLAAGAEYADAHTPEWIPSGSIWGFASWNDRRMAAMAPCVAAIAIGCWSIPRLLARLLWLRPTAPRTPTGRRAVAAASALALGVAVAVVATEPCSALALDWSGAPADSRMVVASLLLGATSAILGLRALLGGLDRSSWWLLELDALALATGSSVATLRVLFAHFTGK